MAQCVSGLTARRDADTARHIGAMRVETSAIRRNQYKNQSVLQQDLADLDSKLQTMFQEVKEIGKRIVTYPRNKCSQQVKLETKDC
ncbi:hypothetical protein VM1G_11425 [Cytospora mali]|uniref:Uncharacterized protein n=1 Tax=Cytospora mali TaxID=578113 RepID=A0A194VSC5_CYTMA|nr:hypothetical protein VM1G_11425 [Valsa mali]